jgi:hypothetical protein
MLRLVRDRTGRGRVLGEEDAAVEHPLATESEFAFSDAGEGRFAAARPDQQRKIMSRSRSTSPASSSCCTTETLPTVRSGVSVVCLKSLTINGITGFDGGVRPVDPIRARENTVVASAGAKPAVVALLVGTASRA